MAAGAGGGAEEGGVINQFLFNFVLAFYDLATILLTKFKIASIIIISSALCKYIHIHFIGGNTDE